MYIMNGKNYLKSCMSKSTLKKKLALYYKMKTRRQMLNLL